MKTALTICGLALVLVSLVVADEECFKKKAAAEKLIREQEKNQSLNLAIVVPNCNEDGTYATLQCHYGSNFCQCWDKEGYPLTQPKKNLKKCSCMIDRAKALKSVPPSQTEIPELTSCERDGSYSPKQCDREACWCVHPETGRKLTNQNRNKSAVNC